MCKHLSFHSWINSCMRTRTNRSLKWSHIGQLTAAGVCALFFGHCVPGFNCLLSLVFIFTSFSIFILSHSSILASIFICFSQVQLNVFRILSLLEKWRSTLAQDMCVSVLSSREGFALATLLFTPVTTPEHGGGHTRSACWEADKEQ